MPLPSILRKRTPSSAAILETPLYSQSSSTVSRPPSYAEAIGKRGRDKYHAENGEVEIIDKKDSWDTCTYNEEVKCDTENQAESSRRWPKEDEYKVLAQYITIIILDDSGSMAFPTGYHSKGDEDNPKSKTRWEAAQRAIGELVEQAVKYDKDGIDLEFLNDERKSGRGLKSAAQVMAAFKFVRPEGGTDIGSRLDGLLMKYRTQLQSTMRYRSSRNAVKKVNFLVITDGEATDDVETVIIDHAVYLHEHNYPNDQVGVQFVQIGNDPDATAFLKRLDDELGPQTWSREHGRKSLAPRDIVDTTPYEGVDLTAERLLKCLIGGINRKRDRTELQPGQ